MTGNFSIYTLHIKTILTNIFQGIQFVIQLYEEEDAKLYIIIKIVR